MSRTNSSVAKMTAGTRIFPDASISHSVSECRVNCEMSITPPVIGLNRTYRTYRIYRRYLITPGALHIDHALRQPRAGLVARDFQLRVSGAFNLHGRTVPADVNRLSPRLAAQTRTVKPNLEAREKHPARRHLIDQRVQPFGEQQLVVGRLALDIDLFQRRDAFRVGDHCRHRDGGLLERLLLCRADAANAHIGLV